MLTKDGDFIMWSNRKSNMEKFKLVDLVTSKEIEQAKNYITTGNPFSISFRTDFIKM